MNETAGDAGHRTLSQSRTEPRNSSQAIDEPLFIVGMPRSGTKLLRDLLNRHARIAIPTTETEFLPWLDSHLQRFGDLSELRNFERFHASITRFPYFMYQRDNGALLSARTWHQACLRFDAAAVFESLIRLDVGAPPTTDTIWGDKSPGYLLELPLLRRLFPRARVVHIVRDARDYCLSIHGAWGKDMLRAAQRWADGVNRVHVDSVLLGERFLEVRYEDLLQTPESVLRRICAFVGIDFRPELLELDRPSEQVGDASGATTIVADNFAKYHQRMSEPLLRRIEAIVGEPLRRAGYPLVHTAQPTARLSRREQLNAKLRDAVNLVRSERAKRGLFGAIVFHARFAILRRG